MSKKSLKITFEHGKEKQTLEWKGFSFEKYAVIDFLNAFLYTLPFDLEVKERETNKE